LAAKNRKFRRDFGKLRDFNQSIQWFILFCSTSAGLLQMKNTKKISERIYKYKTSKKEKVDLMARA